MKKDMPSLAGEEQKRQEEIKQNNFGCSNLNNLSQLTIEHFYYSDPGMVAACEPCFYYGVCDHHPYFDLPKCMEEEKKRWDEEERKVWGST